MVAAALGGALVTLLLVPDRSPAAVPAGVAFQRPVFVGPGGARQAGAAQRIAIPVPGPGRVAVPPGRAWSVSVGPAGQAGVAVPAGQWVISRHGVVRVAGPAGRVQVMLPGRQRFVSGPGGAWVAVPAMVMPGCQVAPPGGQRPGGPVTRFRVVRPPMVRRIVIGPGKRGPHIQIVRPPAPKRVEIHQAGRPGSPGRIVQWTARGRIVVVGPRGMMMAAPPVGPGCMFYARPGGPAGGPPPGR